MLFGESNNMCLLLLKPMHHMSRCPFPTSSHSMSARAPVRLCPCPRVTSVVRRVLCPHMSGKSIIPRPTVCEPIEHRRAIVRTFAAVTGLTWTNVATLTRLQHETASQLDALHGKNGLRLCTGTQIENMIIFNQYCHTKTFQVSTSKCCSETFHLYRRSSHVHANLLQYCVSQEKIELVSLLLLFTFSTFINSFFRAVNSGDTHTTSMQDSHSQFERIHRSRRPVILRQNSRLLYGVAERSVRSQLSS